jgi:hypothetical protein
MDSPVSPKDEIWFLRVCHQVSNAVYYRFSPNVKWPEREAGKLSYSTAVNNKHSYNSNSQIYFHGVML